MEKWKVTRFFSEAGTLGVGSVSFAIVLWLISAYEHFNNKNIPAVWFLVGGCASFCFGMFKAWSRADDRANERKPKLGFSVDSEGFHIAHLRGDAPQFIQIAPIRSNLTMTEVSFDPIDFIEIGGTRSIICRIDGQPAKMDKILFMMFNRLSGVGDVNYEIAIKFTWNEDQLEEKVLLKWISSERRLETNPYGK